MLTRRGFVGCALCALVGFEARAEDAPTPGLKRTIIGRIDGPAAGYETIEARVDIPSGSLVARHKHFGVETSYVVEGGIVLDVEGVGPKTYKAGDGYQVPPETAHSGKAGEATTLAVVFVVEKGKPLATPV